MRKLSLKVLSAMVFWILGIGCVAPLGMVNAQNTPSWFGDVSSTQNVWVIGSWVDQQDKLINVIRNFINWMLGILSLIALVILLWGGFQMVTAAGDDGKYKKGFKILTQAAIGLVFIWISWLVVSVIFWLLGVITA